MITVNVFCPELNVNDSFKLYSRFDFNVLREVLIRFESAALVSEDYVELFEPCTMSLEDSTIGGNEDEA